ncbi:glycine cleavage system H protein [Pilaira anomala]|nr:glycine cleavage system H protein [Pilaira anomala]
MALRLLTSRVLARSYMPVARKSATFAVYRGYATKKFTSDHEWVVVENGVGTFGITDYAQKALGDVVFVETPAVGDVVASGDQVGAIESVKAASDIYSPVAGEVINVNEALSDDPSLLNNSPYDEGWFAKVKLSNPSEVDDLLDEAAYNELIASDE